MCWKSSVSLLPMQTESWRDVLQDMMHTEVNYIKQEGSVPVILVPWPVSLPREWSLMWKGKFIGVRGFPGFYLQTGTSLAFYLGHFVPQLFELEESVWWGVENRRLGVDRRYLVSYSTEFHQNPQVHSSTKSAHCRFKYLFIWTFNHLSIQRRDSIP